MFFKRKKDSEVPRVPDLPDNLPDNAVEDNEKMVAASFNDADAKNESADTDPLDELNKGITELDKEITETEKELDKIDKDLKKIKSD